jgi:hypothetical protein
MWYRRLSILFSIALLTVVAVAPPAAATGTANREGVASIAGVGAPATVVSPGCTFEESSADAVPAASGVNSSRGFVSFGGGNCPRPAFAGRLTYFAGGGAHWFTQPSSYFGQVLAVANDSTGTSVLFSTVRGIFLGKRTQTGSFTTPVRLSTHGNGGAVLPTGDLVTQAGRYWAVWTEQVGPGGEFAQTDLFQAKTIGAGQCTVAITRRQITYLTRHDDTPSLVLVPAAGGLSGAHLTWSRNDGARGESGWIMYAKAGCNAQWSSVQNLNSRNNNLDPDMTRVGNTDYLAWTHDTVAFEGPFPIEGQVPPSGVFDGVSFGNGPEGDAPHMGVSSPTRILVVYRSGGRLASWTSNGDSWHFDYLTGAGAQQQPVAVTQFGGAFTAFGISFSSHRLYSIRVT